MKKALHGFSSTVHTFYSYWKHFHGVYEKVPTWSAKVQRTDCDINHERITKCAMQYLKPLQKIMFYHSVLDQFFIEWRK